MLAGVDRLIKTEVGEHDLGPVVLRPICRRPPHRSSQRSMSTTDGPVSSVEDLERAGLRALDAGDFEAAKKLLLEAVAGYEQLGDELRINAAAYYLGVALAGLGSLHKAVQLWEEIIEHGWDSPAAFNRLHRYYAEHGETDRAEALFRRLDRAASERTGEFFTAPAAAAGSTSRDATPVDVPADDLRRVLVADDEPHIITVIDRALEPMSCAVLTARDGYEALSTLVTTRVGMIFLDVFMPGYSGLDVLYRVRAEGIATPVVIMSGRRSDKVSDAEALGARFLLKPFTPDDVVRLVRTAFGAGGSQGRPPGS